MLSKNHYAAWLYDSAAVQKEEKKKIKCLKKVVPSPSLEPQHCPQKEVARVSPHM